MNNVTLIIQIIFNHDNHYNGIFDICFSIIVFVFSSYRFTQIAVDPQVSVPGGKAYDVLFIGTGKIYKIIVLFMKATT